MARARNIKPAFFSNDTLADIEPLGRLFFIGLWTIADYRGNIEWRERRLKAQILPYDECDVKSIAINLDKSGFIRFYSDGDSIFLNITNFLVHQNPHKNERDKGSLIPEFSEEGRQVIDFKGLTINRDLSGLNQDENASDPADSLILNPESLILIPSAECQPSVNAVDMNIGHLFGFWKETMKKSGATKLDSKRKTAIKNRLKDGYSVEDIRLAIINCSLTPHNMGQNDRGQKFNDIELICRNAANLERFMESNPMQAQQQSADFTGQQSVSNWADGLENEFHGVNK